MKVFFSLIGIGIWLSQSASAGTLNNRFVADQTKWLVHLDLDNFRTTKLGRLLAEQVIDPAIAKAIAEFQPLVKIDLDWHQIRSLTAYGNKYQAGSEPNGVLLVAAEVTLLDSLLEALADESQSDPTANRPVDRVQMNPFPMYRLEQNLFLTRPQPDCLIIGKQSNEVFQAREVVLGKAPNLSQASTFALYPPAPQSFIFLGLAESFRDEAVPPQAELLKKAEGGRLIIGEAPETFFLTLDLKTQTAEISRQIQQVVQGMLALSMLTLAQNEDARGALEMIQNIRVKTSDHFVTINLQFPLEKALALLDDSLAKQHKKQSAHKPPQPSKTNPSDN